jgi:NADH:ubiquinone oxidoreductase subunit C
LHFFAFFFKNNCIFKLHALLDIFAVDYTLNNNNFEISYCFLNITNSLRLFFKLYCSNFVPMPSLYFFFSSANWLEREIWDLFGIKFFLHHDLRRILTDMVS